MAETQPTMRYRPDMVKGATKSERNPEYYCMVFDGDDVESCLKDGWFKHFDDFPKKKKPGRKPKVKP